MHSPNPYEPTVEEAKGSGFAFSRVAAVIEVTGFILGISPTLYMCYICITSLWTIATMEIPTTRIRPMGLTFAMFSLTVIGVALAPVSLGLSWVAKRLGSSDGAMLAKSSVGFFVFPFGLGFLTLIAMMIICGFRGISIGD